MASPPSLPLHLDVFTARGVAVLAAIPSTVTASSATSKKKEKGKVATPLFIVDPLAVPLNTWDDRRASSVRLMLEERRARIQKEDEQQQQQQQQGQLQQHTQKKTLVPLSRATATIVECLAYCIRRCATGTEFSTAVTLYFNEKYGSGDVSVELMAAILNSACGGVANQYALQAPPPPSSSSLSTTTTTNNSGLFAKYGLAWIFAQCLGTLQQDKHDFDVAMGAAFIELLSSLQRILGTTNLSAALFDVPPSTAAAAAAASNAGISRTTNGNNTISSDEWPFVSRRIPVHVALCIAADLLQHSYFFSQAYMNAYFMHHEGSAAISSTTAAISAVAAGAAASAMDKITSSSSLSSNSAEINSLTNNNNNSSANDGQQTVSGGVSLSSSAPNTSSSSSSSFAQAAESLAIRHATQGWSFEGRSELIRDVVQISKGLRKVRLAAPRLSSSSAAAAVAHQQRQQQQTATQSPVPLTSPSSSASTSSGVAASSAPPSPPSPPSSSSSSFSATSFSSLLSLPPPTTAFAASPSLSVAVLDEIIAASLGIKSTSSSNTGATAATTTELIPTSPNGASSSSSSTNNNTHAAAATTTTTRPSTSSGLGAASIDVDTMLTVFMQAWMMEGVQVRKRLAFLLESSTQNAEAVARVNLLQYLDSRALPIFSKAASAARNDPDVSLTPYADAFSTAVESCLAEAVDDHHDTFLGQSTVLRTAPRAFGDMLRIACGIVYSAGEETRRFWAETNEALAHRDIAEAASSDAARVAASALRARDDAESKVQDMTNEIKKLQENIKYLNMNEATRVSDLAIAVEATKMAEREAERAKQEVESLKAALAASTEAAAATKRSGLHGLGASGRLLQSSSPTASSSSKTPVPPSDGCCAIS